MNTSTLRYTLDGSSPTATSPAYEKPFRVEGSTLLTAQRFDDDLAVGPVAQYGYVRIAPTLSEFASNLPILVIDTFGEYVTRYRTRSDTPGPYVRALLYILEPDETGAARLSTAPELVRRAGIRARGSSTMGREKSSFSLEVQDGEGEDLDVPLLGLPPESDWVLLGPFEFDRALMRNALAYSWARDTGRYAPRTRFVELFLNEDGGEISAREQYYGVYLVVEKIKRGSGRVAIESLRPVNGVPAPLEGGYILKIDRPGPGDVGFYSGGRTFHFVYPKERDITVDQSSWIESYLDEFHRTLRSSRLGEVNSYEEFLDVNSAVDYHIINEFTKNPDSYVYSAYIHKPRNGKLTLGPVWDFDRTMGCDNDRRARNPKGWSRNSFRFWYRELFRDDAFLEIYRRRWLELRKGPFAEAEIMKRIDAYRDQLQDAAERNTARWGGWIGLRPGAWWREVEQLKSWIRARLAWYDLAVSKMR